MTLPRNSPISDRLFWCDFTERRPSELSVVGAEKEDPTAGYLEFFS